jgi:hypothetical protein
MLLVGGTIISYADKVKATGALLQWPDQYHNTINLWRSIDQTMQLGRIKEEVVSYFNGWSSEQNMQHPTKAQHTETLHGGYA